MSTTTNFTVRRCITQIFNGIQQVEVKPSPKETCNAAVVLPPP